MGVSLKEVSFYWTQLAARFPVNDRFRRAEVLRRRPPRPVTQWLRCFGVVNVIAQSESCLFVGSESGADRGSPALNVVRFVGPPWQKDSKWAIFTRGRVGSLHLSTDSADNRIGKMRRCSRQPELTVF